MAYQITLQRDPSRLNTDIAVLGEVAAQGHLPERRQFDLVPGELQRLFQSLWEQGHRPEDWGKLASPERLFYEKFDPFRDAQERRAAVLENMIEMLMDHMRQLMELSRPIVIVPENVHTDG